MFGNSIIARLGLDSRDFTDGLRGARAALGTFGAQGVGTLISGAAIKSVTDYGDRIQDLTERYKVNATELQRMGGVAEKEGSSLEGVARGYDKLTKNTSLALKGNQAMIQSFEDLGVTTEDLRTLSPEQIMLKIGKGSMEASSLVKVLGKSALELRPTLQKIADGTAEFSDAIDDIDIQKLSEANDKLKELEASGRVIAADVLVQVGDGFHVVANDARNVAETTKSTWKSAFDAVQQAARGNLKGVINALGEVSLAQQQAVKDLFFYRENAEKSIARVEGKATGPEPEKKKSAADERAERKERERNQLSLEQLQEGPTYADANKADLRAIYASEQAREIKKLEDEAFWLRSFQQNFEGSKALLDRADTMRQGITGLKEGDKDIGAYRTALDGSVMAQDIKGIREEMEREE